MRSRLVMLAVIAIVAAAAALTVVRVIPPSSSHQAPSTGTSLQARPASYLGVFEAGALQSYQPVAKFTKAADRQPNLVGYYSGWRESFQTSSRRRFTGMARPRSSSVGSHLRLPLCDRRRWL